MVLNDESSQVHFSAEDFSRILQESPHGVILHDAATKDILWANTTTLRVLGFTLEELLPLKANHMSGLSTLYHRSRGVQWLHRAATEGMSTIEWKYRSKSGREFLTEAIATRVDLSDRPVVMVQFRDIEREEQTRRALTQTETMFRAILGHMEEGFLVVDDDGRITFASDSSETLLDRSRHMLVGSRFVELCRADSRPAIQEVLALSRQAGKPQPFRFEIVAHDDTTTWISGSCQYVDRDELRGHLILFHDVTAPRLSELQQERDLQHLNYLARFNAMGDMAKTIEHEIAQPLSAATNFLAGVQHRFASGRADESTLLEGVRSAQTQLERAAVIMKSLRNYVTQLEQAMQRVDLNELLAEVRPLLQMRAEQQQVYLDVELAPSEIPVRCERVLTGQVILNLCFNAIEEMSGWPAGFRIVKIETFFGDGVGVFRVTDAGRGLSHIPDGRIFDGAFTSKSSGHGIGLALSHQVILRQDGTITARENPPHGTIFEFALPLDDSELGNPAPVAPATNAIPILRRN